MTTPTTPTDKSLLEKRKGGLRKIFEPSPEKMCLSSEHNPPGDIVLEPGGYEYICPLCGHRQVFTVPLITL